MITKLSTRYYWYKGLTGYDYFVRNYKNKLNTGKELDFIDDPLHENQFQGVYDDTLGTRVLPVVSLIDRLKYKKNLDISAIAISYISYHAGKNLIQDPEVWKEVEFFTTKKFSLLDDRMLFGCYYGLLKSSQCSLRFYETIQKEFHKRCAHKLTEFECFEIIDAVGSNNRQDYDPVTYMHEAIIPRLESNWHRARFLFIDKYLFQLMINLVSKDYYEKSIWEKIIAIINKKNFTNVEKWRKYYEILLAFKDYGLEKYSEIDLDPTFKRLETFWAKNVDFQWKYDLKEKRYHTVEELINKAKDTPMALTWEEAEESIKHTLPEWYFEMDQENDDEVLKLMKEYRKIKNSK
jgi:hypothetical protein